MGGAAFRELETPRMLPGVFQHVKRQCHTALRQLFVAVATPIEGPGKDKFGDIDILVALEKRVVFPTSSSTSGNGAELGDGGAGTVDWSAIKRVLCAVETKQQRPDLMHIAIPWPRDLAGGVEDEDHHAGADQARYIQVDVQVCETIDRLQWMLFKEAHGDLWNMLGACIRPFGLTINDKALYVRNTEMEKDNRKLARVELTHEPGDVLTFLGLECWGKWDRPFESEDAMFEYAASCRLFWIDPPNDGNEVGDGGGVEDDPRKNLKSNDRQRMNKRHAFRRWHEEFIPRCRAEGKYLNPKPEMSKWDIRDQIREEAFTLWGHAKLEYKAKYVKWREEKLRILIQNDVIKGSIPNDLGAAVPVSINGSDAMDMERQYRDVLYSALKKIIMLNDESFGIKPDPPLKDADVLYPIEEIKCWIGANWRKVGDVAWVKQVEKAKEAMQAKLKRKAA